MNKRLRVIYRPNFFEFTGDMCEFITERFDEGLRYGIVTCRFLFKEQISQIAREIFKIPYVNWLCLSPKSECYVFTLNTYGFNKNVDVKQILEKIEEIVGMCYTECLVYPIKNPLVHIKPKYSKDTSRVVVWDSGKLGKKEYKRKLRRIYRTIFRV